MAGITNLLQNMHISPPQQVLQIPNTSSSSNIPKGLFTDVFYRAKEGPATTNQPPTQNGTPNVVILHKASPCEPPSIFHKTPFYNPDTVVQDAALGAVITCPIFDINKRIFNSSQPGTPTTAAVLSDIKIKGFLRSTKAMGAISFVPLIEEGFFRGILYKHAPNDDIKTHASSIATNALLFTLAHFDPRKQSIKSFLRISPTFVILSVAFCSLTDFTNNLTAATVAHSAYNIRVLKLLGKK